MKDIQEKIKTLTETYKVSLRSIAKYFGMSLTEIRRWRDGQKPRNPQNVLDGLNEMIGYSKDEAKDINAISVEFTPKFKIGDAVLAVNGDIYVIEQIQSLSVCFDEQGEVEKKGCWYRVRSDNGHECWAEYDLKPYTKLVKPRWTFTDDEKTILRNLPAEYKWLARDKKGGKLFVYTTRPRKNDEYKTWTCGFFATLSMCAFSHLFQSVQWENEEPCEFRKFIN